jgi:hypothetical protein
MRRDTILAGLGALVLILIAVWVFSMNRSGRSNPDKLDDGTASSRSEGADAMAPASDSTRRCGSQRTYDLVGRELFRQAAMTRGSDAAAFERLAGYAAVRVGAPVMKRRDEGLGTLVCGGRVSIDLPPGVAVVGGRRTLSADLEYALQPAADGSGDVVTLSGAEPIVVPLATLARVSSGTAAPSAAPREPTAPPVPTTAPRPTPDIGPPPAGTRVPPAPPPPPPVRAAPAPRPTATANPSFNCGDARTFGERAVCSDDGLASLDRQMASQYSRASSAASPDQRALLSRTRGRFLGYRDGCRSNDCIADAYRGRMREIDDIMSGRWSPR